MPTPDLHDAYVLHRASFRETSSLVEFWVHDLGIVRAVVQGVHGPGKTASLRNAWLQPFQQLRIEIHGQQDLKKVYKFEPHEPRGTPPSGFLIAGLYANELVLLALRKYDSEITLFDRYSDLLYDLNMIGIDDEESNRQVTRLLRCFEQALLEAIGFSVDWCMDRNSAPIDLNLSYIFVPGDGFQLSSGGGLGGRCINAVGQSNWHVLGALGTARHVLRRQLEWCFDQPLRVPSLQDNSLVGRSLSSV